MKTIAIDAMGGENAPKAIVDAVLKAKPKLKDTKFVLFGDEKKINKLIPTEQKDRIDASERAIRGFCIGKKNWQMIDTIHGAKSSAIIYSIVETAHINVC